MTITGAIRLAAVTYQAGFQIDNFLTRVADLLRAEHVGLAGVLQENTSAAAGICSEMAVVDLASQTRFRISQDLGSQAAGCRLDARGLADIAALLDRPPTSDVELLILNKFGRAEAEGGGLRPAFIRAIEAGIPVLTAVRTTYAEAWSKFHGRLAVDLAPDFDSVLRWCGGSIRELRAARQINHRRSPTIGPAA
jgi:uncharacterized protein DUF2478